MSKKLKNIKFNTYILIIGAFYFIGSVIQNILATKTLGFNNVIICDAGTLISWLVFACMDIITEILGKKSAIKYFTISSVLNVCFTIIFILVDIIPGFDKSMSSSFSDIFATNWRIVLASVVAFLLGNYVNTLIMYLMKTRAKDKNNTLSFILRAIVSTILGQLVDNSLFCLIAFSPLNIPNTYELARENIFQNIAFTTLIEIISESAFSPITALLVKKLKIKQEIEQNGYYQLELGL